MLFLAFCEVLNFYYYVTFCNKSYIAPIFAKSSFVILNVKFYVESIYKLFSFVNSFKKKIEKIFNTDPSNNNDLVRLSYLKNNSVGGSGTYKQILLGKGVKFTNSTGKTIFLIMTGESYNDTSVAVYVGTGTKINAVFTLNSNNHGTQRGMGTLVLKNGDWFYYEGRGTMIDLFQVS